MLHLGQVVDERRRAPLEMRIADLVDPVDPARSEHGLVQHARLVRGEDVQDPVLGWRLRLHAERPSDHPVDEPARLLQPVHLGQQRLERPHAPAAVSGHDHVFLAWTGRVRDRAEQDVPPAGLGHVAEAVARRRGGPGRPGGGVDVPAALGDAPTVPEGIGLVEEDDHSAVARRELPELPVETFDLQDPDPEEHRHERTRLHEDEGLGRLAGHGLRHEGLARARRPPQEDPARHVPAAALDRLRILEEHHVLLDTVQDRVLPFHVGESGLDVVGHIRLDATLGHEPEDRNELQDPDRDDEDDLQDARQRVHQERRRPQDTFDDAHRPLFGAEDVRVGDVAPDDEQEEQDPEHAADPEPCPRVDPFPSAVAPAPDPVPERVVPLPMLGDQVVDLPDELDREEHQDRRVHPDGVVERVVAGHPPDEPEVRPQDEDDPDGREQQQELDAVPPRERLPGGALALLRAAGALHRRPVRDHVVVRHEFTIPSICDW